MMEVKEGYKNTEVGVIPEDWEVVLIENLPPRNKRYGIVDGPFGSNLKTIHYRKSGIPIITSGYVTDGVFHADEYLYVDLKKFKEEIRSAVNGGDIVMAKIGERCGASAILPKSHPVGILSGNALKISIDEKLYSVCLISQIFWFYHITGRFEILRSTGAQPAISMDSLKKFKIPLPPLPEQTAIATVLSDTDSLIQALEKKIAKKQLIKKGAMQELLKPKEGWEKKALGEIGQIITGGTPPTSTKEYWNGTIPWITPTDISAKKDMFHSEREISEAGLSTIRELPENTLLVTCIASIGKNAVLRRRGACNQQINAIIPNMNYNVDFLYYLIEINKEYILGKAGITATLIISRKLFSEIEFSFPKSKEEQIHIAQILSDMDTEIELLQEQLSKYKQLKQGLMQELLTGRIRLMSEL